MKYVVELHIFSNKLKKIMCDKELVDKKGNPDPIKLYNLLYPDDKITQDMIKLDRQKATDKTRNIRNWIQGKNYPKSIRDILLLCNALECDLDYFFTDMECETHDKQFIHDKTGLSEDAINFLIEENEKKDTIGKMILPEFFINYDESEKPNIDLINYLLCRKNDTVKLLDYLYQYIFRSNFKYYIDDNDCLHTSIRLTDETEQSWVSYNVSQLSNILLLNINTCLSNIRQKYIEKS